MSKVLDASCTALGVVSVDGVVLPGATILAEGKATSTGVAVIDEGDSWYLPKTSGDLKTTLDNLANALNETKNALTKVATVLGRHDTAGFWIAASTPYVPLSAADITAINTAATSLGTIKTAIDTLKGALK